MEIEILTTKKKLTKAIVKQLDPATDTDVNLFVMHESNRDAFYIRDLGKSYSPKVCIFKTHDSRWVIIELRDWKISPICPSKIVCKNRYRHFDGSKEGALRASKWIGSYNELKRRALNNHLIL